MTCSSRGPNNDGVTWPLQFREALEAYIAASDRVERGIRRELRLTRRELADLRSGATVPPKRSPTTRRLIQGLVWAAMYQEGVHQGDGSIIRPSLYALATAINAHDAQFEREKWEEHFEEMRDHHRPDFKNMCGLYVLQCLSESGRYLIASTAAGGRLRCLAEITGATGMDREDDGEWFDGGVEITKPDSAIRDNEPLLARGVHFAPWRPWDGDVCLIAVSAKHRMIARMDVPGSRNLAGRISARRELTALLEILDPPADATTAAVYVDPYDDGYEEDENDPKRFGDRWKDGTMYDKRKRNDD